jgi:raffinose/stachyose/melibiose transport system permease protein
LNNKTLKPKGWIIFAFLAPGVLIFLFGVIMPLLTSFWYSLFKWSGGASMDFLGLKNYRDLIHDFDFWFSFKNNLIIIIICIIGQIGIAFIIASLLMSREIILKNFHRTVMFFPVVLSAVVVGFLWYIIYNKDYGILNYFLRAIGLENLIRPWLDDPKYVLFSVSLPLVWQNIGFYLVIILAGFQSIPKEIFEVSELDGATGIKKAVYITLPLLNNTFKVCLMLCISGNMKVFDHIYVMTGGGPGKSSTVLAQYAYNHSFLMFKYGYGSAASVAILIISLFLILISQMLMGGRKNEQ